MDELVEQYCVFEHLCWKSLKTICVFTFMFVSVNPFSLTPPGGHNNNIPLPFQCQIHFLSPILYMYLLRLHKCMCSYRRCILNSVLLWRNIDCTNHTPHSLCCCVTLATDQKCRREIIYISICWYMMTMESY